MRKTITIILIFLLVFAMAACGEKESGSDTTPDVSEQSTTAESEPKEEAGIKYNVKYNVLSDGMAEVAGYEGEGNQITISSEYEGHKVIRISESAFEGCTKIESISIFADVEEIGEAAFRSCTGLEEISIPSSTTKIGNHAFEGCSKLESAIIWGSPDIGDYAFADCISLNEISIGSGTNSVGAHAFEGCYAVTSLIIWGVETIGDYAFAGCLSIEGVSFPNDTKSIGNHSFEGCAALKSVIIWNNETAVGKDAFANCPNLSNIPASRGTVPEYAPDSSDNSENQNTAKTTQNGMRPDFKEAMDSYEAFFDEYCEFMKKYQESDDTTSMLTDYTNYMTKYADTMEKMQALNSDLSEAELNYYIEVTGRITQNLLNVAT